MDWKWALFESIQRGIFVLGVLGILGKSFASTAPTAP